MTKGKNTLARRNMPFANWYYSELAPDQERTAQTYIRVLCQLVSFSNVSKGLAILAKVAVVLAVCLSNFLA